jgi:proline utilization trans-activator
MSLKLPSFPQTKFFLDTFDLIMGSDYHWFQHDTFRKQVQMLYHDPSGPYARDRIWLCRLLTTLAIGQTYVQDAPLVISFDGPQLDNEKLAVSVSSSGTNVRRSTTPPGTDLFEQALNLLHISYEEPRIEHIEVLNLIVSGKFICEISSLRTIGNPLIGSSLLGQSFYCYSLNRRKTAFVYAGMTMRLSNMIGLDKPAGPEFSAVEREHRKRLWWTSYCFDKNTSSEMGWKPAYVLPDHQLGYPSNDGLSEGELLEFHDPGFLTAQVKLTELKLSITETAYRLKAGGSVGTHEIRQCLNVLQNWMSELAPNVAINLTFGIPSELAKVRTVRTSASLVLKYDHVSTRILYLYISNVKLLCGAVHYLASTTFSSTRNCELSRRQYEKYPSGGSTLLRKHLYRSR